MEKYIVVEKPLFLYSGIVGLTKKQFERRKTALKPIKKKKGQYEILSEVCFKVGEEIGFNGPVIKAVRTNLVPEKEYAEKGAESANIEIDIKDFKEMESAFDDLIKRHKALETALDESRFENEQTKLKVSELEKTIEDLKKAEKVDDVKDTDGK
jgi:hypothetical protein